MTIGRTLKGLAVVSAAAAIGATSALAGGFAIREQSTSSQGASFAGNAAGGDLSAMFWNPAATAQFPGFTSENHVAAIFGRAEVSVGSVSGPLSGGFAGFDDSADIAGPAIVPSSYAAYQLKSIDPRLFIGLGTNSGFGLVTKPDDTQYQGSVLARSSKLFTMNANPTLAYQVSPGFTIGIGAQIQYADGALRFATLTPGAQSTYFEGDDIAFGATAGIMLQPTPTTSIGLGWRSALNHELEGVFRSPLVGGGTPIDSSVDLKLPDIVTLSIKQAITPTTRLLGTVEWSNWSRFKELTVVSSGGTLANIEANWHDGWLFSIGAEWDYSRSLTLRTGFAYELSPIQNADERIIGIPDSDRIWASIGLTWKYSEYTSLDLAYTHIFFDDAPFNRNTAAGTNLTGDVDTSTDIISASLKIKWGGSHFLFK